MFLYNKDKGKYKTLFLPSKAIILPVICKPFATFPINESQVFYGRLPAGTLQQMILLITHLFSKQKSSANICKCTCSGKFVGYVIGPTRQFFLINKCYHIDSTPVHCCTTVVSCSSLSSMLELLILCTQAHRPF